MIKKLIEPLNLGLVFKNLFTADTKQAIEVLELYLKRSPNSIKVLDQIANLYLLNGDKEKAIEAKYKVFKYHEYNRNKKRAREAKSWIVSVYPKFFDKPKKVEKIKEEESKEYEEEEISNYEENKVTPNYEEFAFAPNAHGSGFIIGKGKFVITNHHVIEGAKKIAVRNGIGKVTNAKVFAISKDYDLAILKLDKPIFMIISKSKNNVSYEYQSLKIDLPIYVAFSPNSSSIRSNWLYLAVRSVLDKDPVLI